MSAVTMLSARVMLLRRKLDALSANDRKAVLLLGGIVILLTCFYVFQISFDYKHDRYQRLQSNLALTAWIEANATLVKAAGHKTLSTSDPDQSLLSFSTKTAKENGLEFKRFQPEGDNGLSLWLENSSFTGLLTWLHQIGLDAGVHVQQLTIDRLPESDRVDVRVVLQR